MDNLAYLESLGMFRMRPGLSRIRRLLREMGSPEEEIPSVLVGGTNGKGSTCYLLGSIMGALGFRTLVYTSPHLISPTERFLLDGQEVLPEMLDGYIGRVRELMAGIEDQDDMPTYFEVLTAAAFEMARDLSVDCLISEVGLGGKQDATNVLTPAACAITSISLDHVRILGDDVGSIAREKAGIIKPSTPFVLGPLSGAGEDAPKVAKALIDICSQNGSPVVAIVKDEDAVSIQDILEGSLLPDWRLVRLDACADPGGTTGRLSVSGPQEPVMSLPAMRLIDELVPGDHRIKPVGRSQMANAAAAASLAAFILPFVLSMGPINKGDLKGISSLMESDPAEVLNVFGIDKARKGIEKGLEGADIRGRFEIVRKGSPTLVMDVGHNPEAGLNLASTFGEVFPGRKAHMLLSMMADKDAASYASSFRGLLHSLTITVSSRDRGMDLVSLAAAAASIGEDFPIHVRSDPDDAVQHWLLKTGENDIGIACGTFHLYRHVIQSLDGLP